MAGKATARVAALSLHFLPVHTRVPLKFGPETTTAVTCARVAATLVDARGQLAVGWGESPLSVVWLWPSALPYAIRDRELRAFCRLLAEELTAFDYAGHPMEIGHLFMTTRMPALLENRNRELSPEDQMPWLAALGCLAAFDMAMHDAYGNLAGLPVYLTYGPDHMNRDLAWFYDDEERSAFSGKYPADFLTRNPPASLPAWHLVGGVDPLDETELTGAEPDDGYPVLLADWIRRDGLDCLKVKLSGSDPAWDWRRMTRVWEIASGMGVNHLCADFNCQAGRPEAVLAFLDRLEADRPELYRRILYVEQPFPYDLEAHPLDVGVLAARKPLFMDESAHDWRMVRLGRSLGWNGVALKTCKTQTCALLSLCWARARGMSLMVQDLTNPMLAMIPHALLAAHADTVMGVETNATQFYPEASLPEAAVHPGLYSRKNGRVSLDTLGPTGFGYRVDDIGRRLPEPEN